MNFPFKVFRWKTLPIYFWWKQEQEKKHIINSNNKSKKSKSREWNEMNRLPFAAWIGRKYHLHFIDTMKFNCSNRTILLPSKYKHAHTHTHTHIKPNEIRINWLKLVNVFKEKRTKTIYEISIQLVQFCLQIFISWFFAETNFKL